MNKFGQNLSYNGTVNVIDLEALTKGKKEITEFGITIVNCRDKAIVKNYSEYVKPSNLETDYDWFFYSLTGIKEKTLYNAKPLSQVLDILNTNINLVKRPFVCWGEDYLSLLQELRSKRLVQYQPMHVLNLQLLFSLKAGIAENISLKSALEFYNIPFEGSAHSGKVDSFNTAKLFLEILK